jgi:hypothetical protein
MAVIVGECSLCLFPLLQMVVRADRVRRIIRFDNPFALTHLSLEHLNVLLAGVSFLSRGSATTLDFPCQTFQFGGQWQQGPSPPSE